MEYQLVDFSTKWLYKWAVCPVENGELLERAGRKASDLRDFGNFNYGFRIAGGSFKRLLTQEPEFVNPKFYGGRVAQEG